MSWACLVLDSGIDAMGTGAAGFLRDDGDLVAAFSDDLARCLEADWGGAALAAFARPRAALLVLRREDFGTEVEVRFMRYSGATAARR